MSTKKHTEKIKFVIGRHNDVESSHGLKHKWKKYVYLKNSECVLIVFGNTPEHTDERAKKICELVNKEYNL